MAEFTFRDKTIYYEEYGQGRPLVVLNGIMMSCRSWEKFIPSFSAQNRLILLDFLDQGRSSKMEGESYDQTLQAQVLHALLEHLELKQVCLMGISYGGEVAQLFAVRYPSFVERLILFNTTARTGPWLGDIGDGWNKAAPDAESYYLTTIPVIYSPQFYRDKNDWMNNRRGQLVGSVFSDQAFMGSMVRLTNSSRGYDVTEQLHTITAPTLVVSCQQDYLTPMEEQELIVSRIPNSHRVIIPGSGHASMYEQPLLFATLVLGFCNVRDTEYQIS
jgi:pimeloyl-ACP methyl ester carboxylesterase